MVPGTPRERPIPAGTALVRFVSIAAAQTSRTENRKWRVSLLGCVDGLVYPKRTGSARRVLIGIVLAWRGRHHGALCKSRPVVEAGGSGRLACGASRPRKRRRVRLVIAAFHSLRNRLNRRALCRGAVTRGGCPCLCFLCALNVTSLVAILSSLAGSPLGPVKLMQALSGAQYEMCCLVYRRLG